MKKIKDVTIMTFDPAKSVGQFFLELFDRSLDTGSPECNFLIEEAALATGEDGRKFRVQARVGIVFRLDEINPAASEETSSPGPT